MKLHGEELKQLRDSIKQKLENAEFEGRVKIDKDVLEQLLFDSHYVHDDYGERKISKPIKIPVWSGKFLQKIDLSEVDFANVFWGGMGDLDHQIDYEDSERLYKVSSHGNVDYSNTNANIDLSKAFLFNGKIHDFEKNEDVVIEWIQIVDCNFENVDLSNNNLDGKGVHCIDSVFDNTNIKFNNTNFGYHTGFVFNCDMKNTDLSNLTVPLLPLMDGYIYGTGNTSFYDNSCRNSGLKIVCDKESLKEYDDCFDTDEHIEDFWECFREFFDRRDFVGCYLDGTLIESKEQLLELSTNTMKKLIDDYKKTTTEYKMSQLLKSIDEQIDSKKKQDLNDMLSDKVEMIESSIDEQIKSKQ